MVLTRGICKETSNFRDCEPCNLNYSWIQDRGRFDLPASYARLELP